MQTTLMKCKNSNHCIQHKLLKIKMLEVALIDYLTQNGLEETMYDADSEKEDTASLHLKVREYQSLYPHLNYRESLQMVGRQKFQEKKQLQEVEKEFEKAEPVKIIEVVKIKRGRPKKIKLFEEPHILTSSN
jgi:hypothetical protein